MADSQSNWNHNLKNTYFYLADVVPDDAIVKYTKKSNSILLNKNIVPYLKIYKYSQRGKMLDYYKMLEFCRRLFVCRTNKVI